MNAEWLQTIDFRGLTPIKRAFNGGHMALMDLLLQREREAQTLEMAAFKPLHWAAYLGLDTAAMVLLSNGVDPNTQDAQGELPLHKAAREGHTRLVELLAPHCNVNKASNEGMTPLHWACLTGQYEAARILLIHGADPSIRNEAMDGLTAIDMALLMEHEELVNLLNGCEVLV